MGLRKKTRRLSVKDKAVPLILIALFLITKAKAMKTNQPTLATPAALQKNTEDELVLLSERRTRLSEADKDLR